jgi:menaquinone reductase, multiheme cytochrome c subunit
MTRYRGWIAFLIGFTGMLLVGWVIFPMILYTKSEQPVRFSHKAHTEDAAGLTCENCHEFRDDGQFAGLPTVAKCAECHAAQLGESDAEKALVEQFVVPNREIPWFVYARQPENVHFSHAVHVKLGEVQCVRCHGGEGTAEVPRPYEQNIVSGYSRDIWGHNIARIKNAAWDGMKMDDCVSCHQERGVYESCLSCHK